MKSINNSTIGTGKRNERFLSCLFHDFLIIWFCSCCVLCMYILSGSFTFESGSGLLYSIRMALYYSMIGALMSFPIALLTSILSRPARKVLFWIVFILGITNVVLDIVVLETTNEMFNQEHVTLILGSNLSEGFEFCEAYLSFNIIVKICLWVLACFLFLFLVNRLRSCRPCWLNALSAIVFGLLIVGVLGTNVLKNKSYEQVFVGKSLLFADYQTPDDNLGAYRQKPELQFMEDFVPVPKIVVIIGESLCADHCSLYGYEKDTNPFLSVKPAGNMFIFRDVSAAETHTVDAFKEMMTTYRPSGNDGKAWFESLTLFDVAKEAGYSTAWLSNQSKVGLADNVITQFAELTDYQGWAGVRASSYYRKSLDELLLPMVDSLLSQKPVEDPSLTFIHLFGSHTVYSERYPARFEHFSGSDYPELLPAQRNVIASYDNSVLYNDYIVSELIDKYRDKNSIVIYFSDHGQDLFQSAPDYCGHSKNSDPVSVSASMWVPFIVYVSDAAAESHSGLVDRLRETAERPYRLSELMYSISYLMGIGTINGKDISDGSVFSSLADTLIDG